MKLKIDTKPVLYDLCFSTLKSEYSEATSPRSVVKQSGLEFDHFRQYQPGADDAKAIDWIASARVPDILVRVYTENTTLNILLAVDVSESMLYGTKKKAKIEYAIELAINIAFGVLNYGDAIGLMMYNENVVNQYPFKTGITEFGPIRSTLTNSSKFGGGIDFNKILSYMTQGFHGTHLLILISDFLGYGDNLFSAINSVADRFDILGIMVYDESDVRLTHTVPYMNMTDPYSRNQKQVAMYKMIEAYRKLNIERISKMERFFTQLGKDFWYLSTEDPIADVVPRKVLARNYMGK